MKELSFSTKLVRPPGVGTWTYAPIPGGITSLGSLKAKMRVKGTIEGVAFRSSVMACTGSRLFIVIAKELRDRIGKQAGDTAKVKVGIDTSRVTVNIPAELKRAFANDQKAALSFTRMAPSRKKEYVKWINEAKKPETKADRVRRATQMISTGKRLR